VSIRLPRPMKEHWPANEVRIRLRESPEKITSLVYVVHDCVTNNYSFARRKSK
jgi:hypothetical protein